MAELARLLTHPTARHALAHRDIPAVFRILGLAPLPEAAAARRDPACRDLARELVTLRSAA